MSTAAALLGVLAWCGAWIAAAVRAEANRAPEVLGQWTAAFSVCSCLGVFVLLPGLGGEIGPLARWIHHAAFTGLGVFLGAAELVRFTARHQARLGAREKMRACLRQWRWLTEVLPGAAATALLLSGLRLIFENPLRCSAREGWLFWLIVAFGFFFADGLCFYRAAAHDIAAAADAMRADAPGRLAVPGTRAQHLQLTEHALGFPLVFALACGRWPLPHPARPVLARIEDFFAPLPPGWPQVLAAATVIGLVGGATWALRKFTARN